MDRIILEGLECSAHIGVPDEERARKQKIWLDLELEADLSPAAGADDPSNIVDYAKVYDMVLKFVEEKPRRLVEALAYEVADLILYAHPAVDQVKVRVWKRPAVMKKVTRVAAEVTKRR